MNKLKQAISTIDITSNFHPLIKKLLIICMFSLSTTITANDDLSSFQVEVIGHGQPILLIPGLMSDGRVFTELSTVLATQYQLHIINIAGFGSTPKVAIQSLQQVKQQLLTYIKNKQLNKPAIVGHSLGGFLAFWLASEKPNDIGPIISIDGLPFIGPVFTQSNSSTVADLAEQAKAINAFYNNMSSDQLVQQTRFGINRQASSQTSQDLIIKMASTSDPKTIGSAIYTLLSHDLRNTISNIQQPVLLIGAAGAFNDESAKIVAKEMYQQQLNALPKAQLIMNNQARHFIMLDQPKWLIEQIQQFLRASS